MKNSKKQKGKKIKAWCIVDKQTGKITTSEYGALKNLVLNVYPMNERGEKNALGSFNGYEEVVECEIIVSEKKHNCNCEYCKRKHWTIRKEDE